MAKRTRKAEAERGAWRLRRPWPIAVLGVDPGSPAGAALVLPCGADPRLVWCRTVDPLTLQIEEAIDSAAEHAREARLELVLVLEEWGRGGPLGIDSWLGLGASRGHWLRAAHIAARGRHADVLTVSRLYSYAHIATWRSWMDVPPGQYDGGKFIKNDSEGWKKAATRRLLEIDAGVKIDSADAAEAGLIALFGSRSDQVGEKLPRRLLASHGF